MDNRYIIGKIPSYNNHYDLENRFSSFIDGEIYISKNKVKDLNKLKKEIISEKNRHEDKCSNKSNCKTSMMDDKSIEIIESRIQKYSDNKFLKFLYKFCRTFIIPILVGIFLLLIGKLS